METPRRSPLKKGRAERWKRLRPILKPIERISRFLLAVLLCYLGQVCTMPHIQVMNVSPNLIFACSAVMTVCYKRLRTIWAGCLFGIMMEAMYTGATDLYNLLIYPILISFFTIFFADKSDVRLEIERSQNKPGRNMSVYIRTPLCAFCTITLNEVINIVYVMLSGIPMTAVHLSRGLMSIILTVLLTLVIMMPFRALLGFPPPVHQEETETASGEFI